MDPPLPVLGWKEQVALPEWGIARLRAKLDTGARSSALHVDGYEVVDRHVVGGRTLPVLRLVMLVGSRDRPRRRTVTAAATDLRTVRDTGANAELRPVVRTRLVCGPLDAVAEVTITDRTGMNFRMLLGRTLLAGRCLVDPAHGYLRTPRPPSRAGRRTVGDD